MTNLCDRTDDTHPPKSDRGFISQVAGTFVSRIVLIVLGIGTSVLVARSLGPEGRGLVATAGALAAIGAQLGNLGLHAANTYHVAKDRSLVPAVTGNSLLVGISAGAVIAAILGLASIASPRSIPVGGGLLLAALASIPVSIALLLLQNILLGIQDVAAYNIIELGARSLTILVVAALVAADRLSPLVVVLLGPIIASGGIVWAILRISRKAGRPPRVVPSLLRRHAGYGFKAYLAALFSFLVLRFDILMIERMRGAHDTGLYSVAASMADLLFMLPAVVGTMLFPRLSEMSDEGARWRLTGKVAVSTASILVALGATAAILAGRLVVTLYGVEFQPATAPFLILVPGVVALGSNAVLMNYFASRGMPWIAVVSPGGAALLNVLLNLWWIPRFGIQGAAAASTAAYASMLACSIGYLVHVRWAAA